MATSLTPKAPQKLLSLALVAALGVPGILDTKQVTVEVEGAEVRAVRTHADTVAGLLKRQHVEISHADEVTPPLDAELTDGAVIEIDRAVAVRVVDQMGRSQAVLAPVDTVAEVLDEAQLPDGVELVHKSETTEVTDRDVVRIRVPVAVTILAGADPIVVESAAATVADVLAEQGITLGEADRIAPALDTPIAPETFIGITRFESREEVEEVVLPRDEERRDTDALLKGKTRVVEEGADGLRRDTYVVTVVDGRDVSRKLAGSETLSEPATRIVEVGTREPEPAEDDSVWYRLARCESGGRWSYNGTYDGGLQFHPTTWNRWKPSGYPAYAYQATPAQQIVVGKRLQAAQGWAPWPACSRKLGLR